VGLAVLPLPPTRLHAGMVELVVGCPAWPPALFAAAHTNEDAERGQAETAAAAAEEEEDDDNGQGERRTANRDEPQARRGSTWCNG